MLSFSELDLKTDETLDLPPKTIEHTYLEVKLGLAGRLDDPNLKLYTGKLYDGVTEADLIRVREQQGLSLLFSNARTAYFGDAETCQLVDEDMLQNFSDTVAYGSLPISDANASTLRTNRRVLVLDDEADPKDTAAVWGTEPLLKQDGTQVDPLTLLSAASALGDSFGLIAPELHRELTSQETLGDLQGRLAVAQTLSLAGTNLDAEGIEAQLKPLLHDQLWDVAAFQQQLLPDTDYTDLLTLETKVRSDGNAIVQWRYTTEENPDAVLQGKALVAPGDDNTYQVTLLGSTTAQQTVVNQSFNSLVQSQNTPFQFRAGVPEWEGLVKGTCRASDLCRELGVDAIIPKSAIKGDGKTTPVGLHTVEHLFWSRKAEAKAGQQKLGAQVLVNLPESTRTDIEPKVKAELAKLEAATADPRLVADLYIQKYERRQELLAAQGFDGDEEETTKRVDWTYEVLKADTRPTTIVEGIESVELATILPENTWSALQSLATQGLTAEVFVEQANAVLEADPQSETVKRFTVADIVSPVETDATYPTTFSTLQRGGYGQMLEHEKILDSLNRFLQNEWRELALGGITVPSALAQPHSLLQEDEVCFSGMPHGAKVAIYRSPVANVSAFTVLTNNLDTIRTQDREAFRQQGAVYLNKATAKQQLIDFDGDTIALIPELALSKVKAQTLDSLKPNEVYVPGLADGQAVTLYHSRDQVSEFVNKTALADLPEPNTERSRLNQVYVHPAAGVDLEQPMQLGYYDGLHGFQALHAEIERLNLPENRPVQTEKEKKIPRNAYDPSIAKLSPEDQALAARFTTKEAAALDAADNPTGFVANVGMRLEALRTELQSLPDDQKAAYLSEARKGLVKLHKSITDPEAQKTIVPPQTTTDGYDFASELKSLVNGAKLITAQDPTKRLEQVNTQLAQMERFLFQVEGLNAINLQRGVDTPKSARIVNQDWYEFCRGAVYKDVAWVRYQKDDYVYLPTKQKFGESTIADPSPLPNNTQDAVGRLVDLTNEAFVPNPLEYQELKVYDGFLPLTADQPEVEADGDLVKQQIAAYNNAYARAGTLEQKAKTEEGPVLRLKTRDGLIQVTNLTKFDPEGKSPLWDAVRAGKAVEFTIIENNKDVGQGKAWQTQGNKKKEGSHDYAVLASVNGKSLGAIGTLCNLSADKLVEAELKRANPSALYKLQKEHVKDPKELRWSLYRELASETGGLTQRAPESVSGKLVHAGDKAEAKAIKQAAKAARQEWAATIPAADREYWARLAWSNQGQGFALNVFPDVVSQQAETFQFTEATVIGLQYEDWENAADWTKDTTLRIAIGTEAVNPDPTGKPQDPHYGKMIVQAQTEDGWKLVGTLSASMGKGNQKDFQYPVGLVAKGTLVPETDSLIVTTNTLTLTVKPINNALQPTDEAEPTQIKLISVREGKNQVGYVVNLEGEAIATLDDKSYKNVVKEEATSGKIFNTGRRSTIRVAPAAAKTGVLHLKPETVRVPDVWSKHNPDSWLKTLERTGAEAGQVTSTPGVNKDVERVAPVNRDVSTAVVSPVAAPASVPGDSVVPPAAMDALESEPQAAKPVRTGKVLPLPTRLREPGQTTQATAQTTTPVVVNVKPPAVPPVSTVSPLEQQYKEAQTRLTEALEAVGCTPTPEQLDEAIATSVYRETPDLAVATQRLQMITKSPVTQKLYQEQGFEAAAAYVSQVTVSAYQRVQTSKSKAVERNGNGRH